jgi:hypothetical protein
MNMKLITLVLSCLGSSISLTAMDTLTHRKIEVYSPALPHKRTAAALSNPTRAQSALNSYIDQTVPFACDESRKQRFTQLVNKQLELVNNQIAELNESSALLRTFTAPKSRSHDEKLFLIDAQADLENLTSLRALFVKVLAALHRPGTETALCMLTVTLLEKKELASLQSQITEINESIRGLRNFKALAHLTDEEREFVTTAQATRNNLTEKINQVVQDILFLEICRMK